MHSPTSPHPLQSIIQVICHSLGTRFAAVLLLIALPCSASSLQDGKLPEALQSALDIELTDPMADPTQRLALIAQVDQALDKAGVKTGETWIKARFVEAWANMQLNRLDLSMQQIEALKLKLDQREFPELWFQVYSLEAAVLLMHGDRQASLLAHEKLLSSPVGNIAVTLVDRARSNYAEALREAGRVSEAVDLYESIMLGAIERQADTIALQSGNNLVTILLNQEDLQGARDTLDALLPFRSRNPQKIGTLSLLLHELRLKAMEGDIDASISGLHNFLNAQPAAPYWLRGSAYRKLAEALCEKGDFGEAIVNSKAAVELLGDRPNQITDARLTLAQSLVLAENYVAAIEVLDKIDEAEISVPARKVLANRLRLESLLRLEGREEELEAFDAMLTADRISDRQLSKSRTDYMSARLTTARRNLELQQAEAATVAAVERTRIERLYRNWMLGLVSAIAMITCLSIILVFKRRAAQLLLKEHASQNERLESLVNAKTEELRINLKTRADLVEALEKKKRTEAIGLLAGNVAHDLNNLFQVIANTNECLDDSATSPQQRAEYLAVSNETLRHGAGIIKQLLAYSRKQELVCTSTRFTEYLKLTDALFRSAVGERIKLKIVDESSNANILVDTSQMTAALLNIFSNAVDAMPEGGPIEMTARRCSVDQDRCDWTDLNYGEYLALNIRDYGCGMSAEQVAHAFEPFYSTKNSESGTGLGLSSVHGFVRQSGGDIRILSTPDEGTEIQVLLPLTTSEASSPPPAPSGHVAARDHKRMLLVEDNGAVAKSLLKLLEHLGFRAEWAACGKDAIRVLEKDQDFDFVLSDVNMPGETDGLALARWIEREKSKLPVFLMSGYNELPSGNLNIPLIPKPFSVKQLKEFLQQSFATKSKQ